MDSIPSLKNTSLTFRVFAYSILATLLLLPSSLVVSQESFRLAQSLDCGIMSPVPGDVRTRVPWTASVFIRPNSNGTHKVHVNGVIIGPTTILAIAGGAYGRLPKGIKGKYALPDPENVLVGAGMSSTNIQEQDRFAQFAQVEYILPFSGMEKGNEKYHLILYHLTTPLKFHNPQVRTICLPFLIHGRKTTPFGFKYVQGGFVTPPRKDGSLVLRAFDVRGGTERECVDSYRKQYNATLDAENLFCGKVLPGQDPKNVCLMHGTIAAFKLGSRWLISGITALIPSKVQHACPEESKYFYARTVHHLQWMFDSYKCSPKRFACGDSTCIPLSSVCNSVINCKNKSDEDPILCAAQNKCKQNQLTHQCGLNGKCISKNQLCDAKQDCPDGSDEDRSVCSHHLSK